MADAGCINAYDNNGCFLQTIDTLNSEDVGQDVCYRFPNIGNREVDYVCYTDKCGCSCRVDGENEFIIHATQGVLNPITLTQNNTNQTVNVKWSELFGGNWKKTVVRYKTGGYPVSEVDGTLAVEELTQNQYATNGYNVSGLADATTYYFRAFAIAQDDTIIIVQSSAITTDFYQYKPTSNTIAYYKFENNINDSSGNGRNFSMRSGSFSYGTIGNFKYLDINRNAWTYGISSFPFNITSHTTCFRIKMVNWTAADSNAMIFDWWRGGSYGVSRFNNYSGQIKIDNIAYTIPDLSKWYFVCITYRNNTTTLYVNCENKGSNTTGLASGTTTVSFSINNAPDTSSTTYSSQGQVAQLILEKTIWSTALMQKHFNKYKSNFGY